MMESPPNQKSRLDHVLSLVLRAGLSLAIVTVVIGSVLFLWQHGKEIIYDRVFNGEPNSLKGLVNIFDAAIHDGTLAIIQLGIIILIATPVIRVVSCLVVFAAERDFLYVTFSSFVLAVLLFSFF